MLPEIPGFKIDQLIGAGAMAKVYLAHQGITDRKVALKVMDKALAHDPAFRDRFLKEARDTAKFSHEGIVTIYNADVYNDIYFIALEFLEAGTLKDRLRARVEFNQQSGTDGTTLLSADESLEILRQLAEALAYAHDKGVIHRDIKPANILFRSNGKAVLSDFGIAKSTRDDRNLTQTGHSIGTPAYMSPEQKLGADVDERSDLYSLGVVFYEILTGAKPFSSDSGNYAELRKQLDQSVPTLPQPCAHLQPLVDKLLAGDPDERYQSAYELIEDIRQYSRRSASSFDDATVLQSHRAPAGPAPAKPFWKLKRVQAGLAAALLLLVAGSVVFMNSPEAIPEPEPVSTESMAQIKELLETAQTYLDLDWIVSPPVSNAVEMFNRVLSLQPGNREALSGLSQAEEVLTRTITEELSNGDAATARTLLELGLHHFPHNKQLADLQTQASQ